MTGGEEQYHVVKKLRFDSPSASLFVSFGSENSGDHKHHKDTKWLGVHKARKNQPTQPKKPKAQSTGHAATERHEHA